MNRFLTFSGVIMLLAGLAPGTARAGRLPGRGDALAFRSADGRIQAALGVNLQLDGSLLYPDAGSSLGISGDGARHANLYPRRLNLTLSGSAYGFDFNFTQDLSDADDLPGGLKDLWVGHHIGGTNAILMVGQHKPWRSLDELASSRNVLFVENNALSANGLLGGRNYGQGLFYRWLRRGALARRDQLWLGAALYSNTKDDKGFAGYGANARIVYAPFIAPRQWLHLGANYSYDQSPAYSTRSPANGYGAPAAGYSTWYGTRSNPARVAKFGPGPVSSAALLTGELAAAIGPLYLQDEYGRARLQQGLRHADVRAFSVAIAYSLTGETRSYSPANATYGALRPAHHLGAVEAVLRYDGIDNRNLSSCALKIGATRCDVLSVTAGLNYYPNSHVRFMLQYVTGLADAGVAGTDHPHAIEARAIAAF
jgi:phosphate-selective porin OprO/OprP